MKLVFIHGHGATRDSWKWLMLMLGGYESITLSYDSQHGFAPNLDEMENALKDEREVFFIAHSWGGQYALHLADRMGDRCLGAVTMATPYGGCEAALALNIALVLNLRAPNQLYVDAHPNAHPVTQGRAIELGGRHWTAIVTTKGHSNLMGAANDGVVTAASMRSRRGARFVEVESNHHEVVQSCRALEIIQAAIAEVEELQVAA